MLLSFLFNIVHGNKIYSHAYYFSHYLHFAFFKKYIETNKMYHYITYK